MSQNDQAHLKNLSPNVARCHGVSYHFGTLCISGLLKITENNVASYFLYQASEKSIHKKVRYINTVLLKLIKLSTDFVTPSVMKAINTNITQNHFFLKTLEQQVILLGLGKPNIKKMKF